MHYKLPWFAKELLTQGEAMYLSKTIIIVCFVLFYLPAYATTTISSFPGISGIARMSSNEYLIVHDAKNCEEDKPRCDPKNPRIGLLNIKSASGRIEYKQLDFPAAASSLSSDLEGVCRVPNKSNEFFLAESGYWDGKFGRIFHIRVTMQRRVVLVDEFQLPKSGDQFEGIACIAINSADVLILLGERGGSEANPKGVLRWGTYNLVTRQQPAWSEQSQEVTAPNPWGVSGLRTITGLSIDGENRLWGSAAVDPDNNDGPFRSVVYLIGHVDVNIKVPVKAI